MKMLVFILSALVSCTALSETPEELGKVNWLRNYDAALLESSSTDKPVLILFQEVPGCSTCRNYGHNVLSHPLMVEAIEEYFVPLAIYNNKGGADAEVLKKYGEPSWNNPVVRVVDSEGRNLTKRLASDYSAIGLYHTMEQVLEAEGIEPAPYFDLLGQELGARNTETAYYKMYCFWSGEGHMGQVDGVVSTEPGFMDGAEVVKVEYDPKVVDRKDLDAYASQAKCTVTDKKAGYRVDKDPQYYLKNSEFKYLPLSEIQRTKINSALAKGTDPAVFLSPKQKLWYKEIKSGKSRKEALYHLRLEKAWEQKIKET